MTHNDPQKALKRDRTLINPFLKGLKNKEGLRGESPSNMSGALLRNNAGIELHVANLPTLLAHSTWQQNAPSVGDRPERAQSGRSPSQPGATWSG